MGKDGNGVVTSPGYPGHYPHEKDVTTPISVPQGCRIELTFVDFKLEDHGSCGYDYVQGMINEKNLK